MILREYLSLNWLAVIADACLRQNLAENLLTSSVPATVVMLQPILLLAYAVHEEPRICLSIANSSIGEAIVLVPESGN